MSPEEWHPMAALRPTQAYIYTAFALYTPTPLAYTHIPGTNHLQVHAGVHIVFCGKLAGPYRTIGVSLLKWLEKERKRDVLLQKDPQVAEITSCAHSNFWFCSHTLHWSVGYPEGIPTHSRTLHRLDKGIRELVFQRIGKISPHNCSGWRGAPEYA